MAPNGFFMNPYYKDLDTLCTLYFDLEIGLAYHFYLQTMFHVSKTIRPTAFFKNTYLFSNENIRLDFDGKQVLANPDIF